MPLNWNKRNTTKVAAQDAIPYVIIAVLIGIIVGIIVGHMRAAEDATLLGAIRDGFMAFVASAALMLAIMGAFGAFPVGLRESVDNPYEPECRKVMQIEAAGKLNKAEEQ